MAIRARWLVASTFALAIASFDASAQDPPAGTVRICRQAGVVDVNAGVPIGIPSGATFVDNGMITASPTGVSVNPISVATTEAAQIAANAACTTARAQISQRSADAAAEVRVTDGRRLSPARTAGTDLPHWPGNLYLVAMIASDFH